MLKNKVVFGIAISAAAGFLVYQLATSEQAPQAQAPVSTSTINAPVSKPSPNAAEQQASLASQALSPSTTNSEESANHKSHAVPMPPEGANRDSSAKYSQSRPHGHENMNHRDERGRVPPGQPLRENAPKATPPNAPAN